LRGASGDAFASSGCCEARQPRSNPPAQRPLPLLQRGLGGFQRATHVGAGLALPDQDDCKGAASSAPTIWTLRGGHRRWPTWQSPCDPVDVGLLRKASQSPTSGTPAPSKRPLLEALCARGLPRHFVARNVRQLRAPVAHKRHRYQGDCRGNREGVPLITSAVFPLVPSDDIMPK